MREKAGPKNSKTWAICFPELKDPLGKPLFPTQNAARMFASRWGISTEMLHWTREEVDFLYRTQDIPVRVVKRKLLDEFEKDVTLEQVRYKGKKIRMQALYLYRTQQEQQRQRERRPQPRVHVVASAFDGGTCCRRSTCRKSRTRGHRVQHSISIVISLKGSWK